MMKSILPSTGMKYQIAMSFIVIHYFTKRIMKRYMQFEIVTFHIQYDTESDSGTD